MALDDEILVATENRIRLITINRENVRNARTRAHNRRIAEAIMEADHDPDISLIAITGAGSKAFSSGADLKDAAEMADRGEANRGPLHSAERSVHEVVIDSKKPCMAIVNGPALAGGFELVLACDVRIAADHAFFAMTEAKRGRGAHFASVLLPQIVPPAIAMEWLFTGRKIPAQEAERWGLVNRIVPSERLMKTAMAFAGEIISSAPLSLQRMKQAYRKTHNMPLQEAIRVSS
ncbi:MAG: enoyl-CoA hydratase [Rhodospirillales bacterium]|nr:enoyl-CoA hydratase [Rhodospirillales bacterium]